uniref:C2H2-type domain-containing protein n=1 Tax=Fagus sylvatica TaxID=28930 RepID=A0A2N9IQ50_FAGSY
MKDRPTQLDSTELKTKLVQLKIPLAQLEIDEMGEIEKPIFRDIRRYYCDFCGICRSKKTLITSHILTHHKEVMEENEVDGKEEKEGKKSNMCQDCGATFMKPAYLKQHMQSHSIECEALDPIQKYSKMREAASSDLNGLVSGGRPPEKLHRRPYTCPIDDCHSSYRRKDHLTRHLLQHKGELFKCPIENCGREFSFQGNMKRHVNEFHIKLDSVEALCCEPGCMKYFANDQCLKAHIQSCHQHITCEICGTKQLKRNIKRHLRIHEDKVSLERIKCHYNGCLHTFSTKSNLNQHIKAVHLDLKPFACSFSGCGIRFAHKHVRDKHEKTCHVYTPGDFEESDEQFQSRPRGGRKRKFPIIEMLIRKRITPPSQSDEESGYLAWLHSQRTSDEH